MDAAGTAAALLAVDPAGLGGAVLRTRSHLAATAWLDHLRSLLPEATPWQRMPAAIDDTTLLGGLDLGATLQLGRPALRTGLLARCDRGVLVLPMAERTEAALAARLAAVLDTGGLQLQRDGLQADIPARLALVALDQGADDDEHLPAPLADRLALQLLLAEPGQADDLVDGIDRAAVLQARAMLPSVQVDGPLLHSFCAAAQALGIASLRAPLLALRAARAAAALDGCARVLEHHAQLAAQLVLGPRATRVPAPPESSQDEEPPPPRQQAQSEPPPESAEPPHQDPPPAPTAKELADRVLAAARATLPAGLLAALAIRQAAQSRGSAGTAGAQRRGQAHGRPLGSRRQPPRGGQRLDLLATLRAAAPWQPLRAREWSQRAPAGAIPPRVHVRTDDFHVRRVRERTRSTTVFVVDASGSAALHRLAEAKGAVECLLAECYVRRDQVAVLAFRGTEAQLLLPPTRSLARAKRSLAGLPGGGGTPLATALDATAALADAIRRRGEQPLLVLLTDGRANIARDGTPGRTQAGEDALAAARALRAQGLPALLVDTAPHPQPPARALADALGARYLPLPPAGGPALAAALQRG